MSDINKESSMLSIFDPTSGWRGTLDTSAYPRLVNDNQVNNVIYNTLGSMVSVGAVTATAMELADRYYKKKWDKKSKQIAIDKVNATRPISRPNYNDNTVKEIAEARASAEIELLNDADNIPKEANIVTRTIGYTAPVIGGVLAYQAVKKFKGDRDEDKRNDELDIEIAKRRNNIDALHAELLELHTGVNINKVATADPFTLFDLMKSKSVKEFIPEVKGEGNGLWEKLVTVPVAALALLSVGAGIGSYRVMRDMDVNRKMLKVMPEVAGRNNTYIPQELTISVDPTTKKTTVKQVAKEGEIADVVDVPAIEDNMPIIPEIVENTEKDALF